MFLVQIKYFVTAIPYSVSVCDFNLILSKPIWFYLKRQIDTTRTVYFIASLTSITRYSTNGLVIMLHIFSHSFVMCFSLGAVCTID